MIRLYFGIPILFTLGVFAQENPYENIAPRLSECYENKSLVEKDNRLPNTLNTLIAIIRKIENTENVKDMDLRSLTVAIMHRFRGDGIEENPAVVKKSGVSPYRFNRYRGGKFLQILRFIPEREVVLPYNIIPDIERCSLHFMLSNSIEIFKRDDEDRVCKYAENAYRRARSIGGNHFTNKNVDIHRDVETLTPEQIEVITNHKDGATKDEDVDPNALYPELPPNHPEIARVLAISWPSKSRCPVENGVIKTKWGAISAGSLIAGIAAGLQPETVKLSEVFPYETNERKENLSLLSLDNKWIATFAGDLAEVILIQAPLNEKLSVGVNGNWNSSFLPRWYFLNSNEKLQFTTAEIRGDLDGLILANEIEFLYSKIPRLKLSQILDMYYSSRGLVNSSIKACNRKVLFEKIAQNSTMSAQAYIASLVLDNSLHTATMTDEAIKTFATQATNELSEYIRSSMSKDLSCQTTMTGTVDDVIQIAIDLTIILDTTWPLDIQPIIANILDNLEINQYNSQFTLINGGDGSIMINTTTSILDFSHYITNYKNVTGGFDLAKSFDILGTLQRKKLDDERYGLGHAKSDVVLIIPYRSTVSDNDKEYCIEQIKKMQEQVPDATLLILSYGSKDKWVYFVKNSITDLFSINNGDMQGASPTIVSLISRIKQVPQRLINTQCGSDYSSTGSSISFNDYIEPATVISYKLHPNYFFSTDSDHVSTIKIIGSDWGNLKVCTARHSININSTEDGSVSCVSITNEHNEHTVSFGCGDAGMINRCQPLYLSVIANSSVTNYLCEEINVCRFPHMIKYTVSYDNLVCTSSASMNMLSTIVLIISMIYIFL